MKRIVMLATLAVVISGTAHASMADELSPDQIEWMIAPVCSDETDPAALKFCRCVLTFMTEHMSSQEYLANMLVWDRIGGMPKPV